MSKTEKTTEKRNKLDNLIPFQKGVNNDPPAETKKAGRDRKRQAQKIMDYILQYQTMTKEELEEMSKRKDLTILELTMIRYVVGGMKNDKFLLDMIDRHVPKAPTQMEMTGNAGGSISISVEEKSKIDGLLGASLGQTPKE